MRALYYQVKESKLFRFYGGKPSAGRAEATEAMTTGGTQCGSVYIHFPFCAGRCRYCDFYSVSSPGPEVVDSYLAAVRTEFERYCAAGRVKRPVDTLYLGGGTPTCVGAETLHAFLEWITAEAGYPGELTVEANPRYVDSEMPAALASAGVNRLVIGAQSFDENNLHLLGRRHGPDDVAAAFESFLQAGIDTVGIDLIFGVPGASLETWQRDITTALSPGPKHLSAYLLTVEPGTPLADDMAAGRIAAGEDDLVREMYDQGVRILSDAGYEHYEISNFCMPGHRCEHNLVYWRNDEYIGLGPSAASYYAGVRRRNVSCLESYIAALTAGREPPFESERLEGLTAAAEALMLSLRLSEGVAIETFIARYGGSPAELFPRTTRRYLQTGVLELTSRSLRISPDHLFTSNTVLADFLAEAREIDSVGRPLGN